MPYPYAQGSNYAAGDYYAYGAGGIFGSIGKALGGVAKFAGGLIPGPVGGIVSKVGGVLAPTKQPTGIIGTGMIPYMPPIPVPSGTPGAVPAGGLKGVLQRALPGGASGFQSGPGGVPGMSGYHLDKATGTRWVRNRSMNPGNARALRRAIRREQSFVALAKRALRGSGYTFKRTGAPKARKRVRR